MACSNHSCSAKRADYSEDLDYGSSNPIGGQLLYTLKNASGQAFPIIFFVGSPDCHLFKLMTDLASLIT